MANRIKMSIADRAKQFLSFASLRGYEDCVREKEELVYEKIDIDEEKAKKINSELKKLNKGDMVKVVYYSDGKYINLEGVLTNVDFTFKTLKVIKTEISFKDIYDLEKGDESGIDTCE